MTKRGKRFLFIVVAVAALGVAVGLVLNALKDNVSLYYTPTQVFNKEAPLDHTFRIGGLVAKHSVTRENDGLTIHFVVTDLAKSIPVVYKGIVPDLFKEGTGAVVEGKMEKDGVFHASNVLAKHSADYKAPAVVDALAQAKAASAVKAAEKAAK